MDFTTAFLGLLVFSPILMVVMALVWFEDFKSPFYIAIRIGKDGKEFNMVKLRSMKINLVNSGPDSTSENDDRITPIGHIIRKYKLDELSQLWNVLIGDMSLVGPRPNVKSEVDLYTNLEKKLFNVKPGITDFSSIVFSDEAHILADMDDPDLAYNQLIRPWKSRLGLIYIENRTLTLDFLLIFYTVVTIIKKKSALVWVARKLHSLGVDEDIVRVCRRQTDLVPCAPPGADEIVMHR